MWHRLFFLSRRPLHGAAAEQVDVEVIDRLPPVGTGVDDQAVARCGEALLFGDLAGFEQQVAEQGAVLGSGVLHAGDDFLGDDEDVRRGLGLDVAESQTIVVLIDDVGGNFAADDFAKNSLFAH